MPVKINTNSGKTIAYLSGEIDHHNAWPLREAIDNELRRLRPGTLRMDFGGVSFMDSSGVGLVMGRYKTLSAYGGRLELMNVPAQIYKVMKLSGIEKIAKIYRKDVNKGEDNQ
ncbi:MAG: STAS domain-containing protein [Oscillospiraceae bacterium]|nr:STAS domain-containing protein [Oscillospiraceae bacterium]